MVTIHSWRVHSNRKVLGGLQILGINDISGYQRHDVIELTCINASYTYVVNKKQGHTDGQLFSKQAEGLNNDIHDIPTFYSAPWHEALR